MTSVPDQIRNFYEEAKLRRAEAFREYERASIEMEAFERLLKATVREVPDVPSRPDRVPPTSSAAKGRGLSIRWLSVFRKLVRHKDAPYSYDDILDAGQMAGQSLNRNGLRTQMGNMVKRGAFVRVDDGTFDLTESGRDLIGMPKNNEAPARARASETVGPHGGGSGFPSRLPESSILSGSTDLPVRKITRDLLSGSAAGSLTSPLFANRQTPPGEKGD